MRPFIFQGDLRRLPTVRSWQPGDPIKEIPRRTHPRTVPRQHFDRKSQIAVPDPLRTRGPADTPNGVASGFLSPVLNLDGQGFSGVNPPDPSGDIGQSYYIQMINHAQGSVMTIYNKATGTTAAGPIFLDSLGAGNCANGLGDPIVLYDRMANRWLLSEFSITGNRLCVYISQTSNPITGGWYNYDFAAPSFPDYPKYAVWHDAYYVTSNETSPAIYALDRNNMLAGMVARPFIRMTFPDLAGFGFQALTPADFDGPADPPAGATIPVARHNDDEAHSPGTNDPAQDLLEIWSFSVDFDTPGNSTLTGPLSLPIAEIDSDLCGLSSFSCIPQPSGSNDLDPLREVLMWRLQYRNLGTHEALIGNLSTDVNGNDLSGIRWFELRRSGGGNWQLFQEGTHSPDDDHRFMGSAAMDVNGNLALAYNVSSSTVSPSLRYAGRLAADPAGTLPQSEASIVAGSASNSSNRYGDYSSLTVDPVDDCTFWFTGEYNAATTWSTRIAAFRFDDCEQCEPLPVADAGEDELICLGNPITLGTTAQPDTSYSWSPGGEVTAQIEVNPTATTVYTLTATTACGQAQDQVLVSVDDGTSAGIDEDFENGLGLWTVSGLWHRVDESSCATPGYESPTHAMYYGQDNSCTYATGSGTAGDLISPVLFGIDATSVLTFEYFRNVEFFADVNYDQTEVAVTADGGGSWSTLWSRSSADISENAWTSSGPLSLAAFAGQPIQIRFRFDSLDGSFNAYTGWFVDDIVVTGNSPCPPPNEPPAVTITAPIEGAMVAQDSTVEFNGTANDLEDGDLSATIAWSSNLDGDLGTGATIQAVLTTIGTHTILASVTDSGGDSATDDRTLEVFEVINTAPQISILTPAEDVTISEGAALALSASATDAEDGDLSASVTWSSGLDGTLGTGGSINVSLSLGVHTLIASVTDSAGETALDDRTIEVVNTAPQISILSPSGDVSLLEGTALTLNALASDTEDGDLTASVTWTSDLDGALGTGGSINVVLSTGVHTLMASVTDSGGRSANASRTVTIRTATIFANGFENGSVNAWSSSAP